MCSSRRIGCLRSYVGDSVWSTPTPHLTSKVQSFLLLINFTIPDRRHYTHWHTHTSSYTRKTPSNTPFSSIRATLVRVYLICYHPPQHFPIPHGSLSVGDLIFLKLLPQCLSRLMNIGGNQLVRVTRAEDDDDDDDNNTFRCVCWAGNWNEFHPAQKFRLLRAWRLIKVYTDYRRQPKMA